METKLFSLLVILCLGVRSSSEILRRQKRTWIIDSFGFSEGYSGPFPFPLGVVNVNETYIFSQIHGQGVDKEPRHLIGFNNNTGDISMLGPVDREKYDIFKLTFTAYDKTTHKIESLLGINIHIFDINDNPPLFEQQEYNITLEEATLQGTDLITVKATDRDIKEENRKFKFSIDSVTPTPHDLEFFINEVPVSNKGTVSFKGCLDYEKADKYTVIVTATDEGKPKPLSSSCTVIINIEDGNNHIPVFTEETASERVKEGLENVFVSRLQVADDDPRGTGAWKAKYKIHRDKSNNFRIITDPETNEGLLYVNKHLDFEDDPVKNITITVENEIPYFTCRVIKRNAVGLWTIETSNDIIFSGAQIRGGGGDTEDKSSYKVTVNVEDINEPPIFDQPKKQISVPENTEMGQYLETLSARDPDVISGNKIKYIKGEDPAGYLTVDPETGSIATSKILDRESPFVENGVYVVTIYAVDQGEPPLTGTSTLSIHIIDVNDHAPFLNVSTIEMCQSNEISKANLTVLDLDEEPYVGPFRFKLLEDVGDKWRVEPNHGYSVNLVKENKVYSGHHELLIEVSDLQGMTAVQKLSVIVCDCLDVTQPNCRNPKASKSKLRGEALGIFYLSILLLAGLLLVTFLVSCKDRKIMIPEEGVSGHLIISNTEEPGTDCNNPFELINNSNHEEQMLIKSHIVPVTMAPVSFDFGNHSNHGEEMQIKRSQVEPVTTSPVVTNTKTNSEAFGMTSSCTIMSQQTRTSQGVGSSMRMRHQLDWMRQSQHRHYSIIKRVLEIKLDTMHARGVELSDYEPVVYAEEGDMMEHNYELDDISITELSFDPDLNLDSRFFALASVCLPDNITAQRAKH